MQRVAAILLTCACMSRAGLAEPTALVVFTTQGGVISVKDQLTIYPDGGVTLKRREGPPLQQQLSQAQLEKLKGRLATVKAPAPARSGGPPPSAADGQIFNLEVDWKGKRTSLSWSDPTPIPPSVKLLVLSLEELEMQMEGRR